VSLNPTTESCGIYYYYVAADRNSVAVTNLVAPVAHYNIRTSRIVAFEMIVVETYTRDFLIIIHLLTN
jgi:hypothetical protein